jgi:hypothetical protein
MLLSGLNHTARPFRCLRFAEWIAPPPRKTHFRMAGQPFRTGWLPAGSQRKVSAHLILLSQASPGAPFAELKGEFALDMVPTNQYGANSAWLQLSILTHNLMCSFQLHSTLATPKPRSRNRTYSYRIASMKTLRFLLINRAARLARISGHQVLRFSANSATKTLQIKPSTALPPKLIRFRAKKLPKSHHTIWIRPYNNMTRTYYKLTSSRLATKFKSS